MIIKHISNYDLKLNWRSLGLFALHIVRILALLAECNFENTLRQEIWHQTLFITIYMVLEK